MDERQDYYSAGGRKVADFFLGFGGTVLLGVIAGVVAAASPNTGIVSAIANLILLVAGVVYFFRRGRRFIAIGIISTLTIPLLALGACAIIFVGSSFH
jgi:hypothetical protein